jgi:hypothetical protein
MHEKIKTFVKHTLGCACPEEVFKHIDCKQNIKLNDDISLNSKINIGNRLLIYVVEADNPDFITINLPLLVHAGKKERDSSGFNRLRLVIATDKMDGIKEITNSVFQAIGNRDEKIHLHIIHKKDLSLLLA